MDDDEFCGEAVPPASNRWEWIWAGIYVFKLVADVLGSIQEFVESLMDMLGEHRNYTYDRSAFADEVRASLEQITEVSDAEPARGTQNPE